MKNREIKFRAWTQVDSSGKHEMWDWETWKHSIVEWIGNEESGAVFMQYTGLKDKNGTGVYEGDIVEVTEQKIHQHWPAFTLKRKKKKRVRFITTFSTVEGTKFEVYNQMDYENKFRPEDYNIRQVWQTDYDGKIDVRGRGDWSCGDTWNRDFIEYRNMEVIGNIYEDSHLLEKESDTLT